MHAIVFAAALAATVAGGTPAPAVDYHLLAARLTAFRASVDLFTDHLEIMELNRLDVCAYLLGRDLRAVGVDTHIAILRDCDRARIREAAFRAELDDCNLFI